MERGKVLLLMKTEDADISALKHPSKLVYILRSVDEMHPLLQRILERKVLMSVEREGKRYERFLFTNPTCLIGKEKACHGRICPPPTPPNWVMHPT
jgi:hypothetical protein